MYIIVGLGNPGKKYSNTKHNIGFMCIDKFIKSSCKSTICYNKFFSIYYKNYINNHTLHILKPQVYMNLSGISVYKASFFLKSKNIIIIHDDVNTPLGTIKIDNIGHHNGHNGIKNIISYIGSNFIRIKIGISTQYNNHQKKYVLSNFNNIDANALDLLLLDVIRIIKLIIINGFSYVKNYVNNGINI